MLVTKMMKTCVTPRLLGHHRDNKMTKNGSDNNNSRFKND